MRIRRYRIARQLQLLKSSMSRTSLGRAFRRRKLRKKFSEPITILSQNENGQLDKEFPGDEDYLSQLSEPKVPRKVFWNLALLYTMIGLVLFGTLAMRNGMVRPAAMFVWSQTGKGSRALMGAMQMDTATSKIILQSGLPAMKNNDSKITERKILGVMSKNLQKSIPLVMDVDLTDPATVLKSQIYSLDGVDSPARVMSRALINKQKKIKKVSQKKPVRETPAKEIAEVESVKPLSEKDKEETQTQPEKQPKADQQDVQNQSQDKVQSSKPLALIYHTHTSETYSGENGNYIWQSKTPEKGKEYYWGTARGVVTVGTELAVTLEKKYGIKTVHSKRVHDYPVFRDAYKNALITVEDLLKSSPSVKAVFDIHRDGLATHDSTITINGVKAARVFICVTSDKFGLPHPHWRENYAFALKLHETINKMYPGLSRGVNLRNDARWNQHVHNHAVILEVGSNKNTTEEALVTARLLADPIASILKELAE